MFDRDWGDMFTILLIRIIPLSMHHSPLTVVILIGRALLGVQVSVAIKDEKVLR